jgi:hypothetical protein
MQRLQDISFDRAPVFTPVFNPMKLLEVNGSRALREDDWRKLPLHMSFVGRNASGKTVQSCQAPSFAYEGCVV